MPKAKKKADKRAKSSFDVSTPETDNDNVFFDVNIETLSNEAASLPASDAIKLILETLQGITKSIGDLVKSNNELMCENKNQSKKIDNLIEDIKICKKENEVIKRENIFLHEKINNLEQYSRNYNLEIQGVPFDKTENTYNITVDVANQLGCNIDTSDIEFCHRLKNNSKNPNQPPTIIAKFYSRRIKETILDGRKTKKFILARDIGYQNSVLRIYVNEHLTATNKNLYWLARNTKQFGYKYAWVRSGRIYIRQDDNSPVIPINRPTDIPLSGRRE